MKAWLPIAMNPYRGGAAVVLGILLLFIPDKSKDFLFNTMGFFWLSIGFTVLRRSEEDKRYPGKHTALIAGLVAIVTGLLVVTRRFTRPRIGEDVIFFILGTVILATGILHIINEIRIGGIKTDRQTGIHFFLGLFEVLLGGLLILSPQIRQPIVYWTATVWAVFYGAMFIGTAVHEFVRSRQEKTESETAEETVDGKDEFELLCEESGEGIAKVL